MCNVCGCGAGETTIDGKAVDHEHGHEHGGHFHVHADGTAHDHDHSHVHEHEHAREHAQGKHMHYHLHEDGTSHEHDHVHDHTHAHDHSHDHGHSHAHDTVHYGQGPAGAHAPGMTQVRMVKIEQDILSKNDGYANDNRSYLAGHGIFALNLVSSPGSGKTTLLVKSISALNGSLPLAVIEGDQQTDNDAARIRATSAPALQINTGKGCHLDAFMVGKAMAQLQLADDSLLLIENVGNLVCPAGFDLGEAHKVVILSVTEGEDKPLKYPDMFAAADLMLLTKVDLLPHLRFDAAKCIGFARRIHPRIEVMQVSALDGTGMDGWLDWIGRGAAAAAVERASA